MQRCILRPPDAQRSVDYICLEQLGKGTYGTCYKVAHKGVSEALVMKVVPLTGLSEKDVQSSFAEAVTLSRVRHPHVVDYLDAWVECAHLYIVMEYCEGGDLRAWLSQRAEFSEAAVWRLARDVACGLEYLHQRGFMHRDIKPSNIFLKGAKAVIGDLGLCRSVSASHLATTQVGTPLYYSPEVCKESPYGLASDVWAFGCLMYELVVGLPPYIAANQVALSDKICNASPRPLPRYVSSALSDLIGRMLRKDPASRPTALEIFQISTAMTLGGASPFAAANVKPSTAVEKPSPAKNASTGGTSGAANGVGKLQQELSQLQQELDAARAQVTHRDSLLRGLRESLNEAEEAHRAALSKQAANCYACKTSLAKAECDAFRIESLEHLLMNAKQCAEDQLRQLREVTKERDALRVQLKGATACAAPSGYPATPRILRELATYSNEMRAAARPSAGSAPQPNATPAQSSTRIDSAISATSEASAAALALPVPASAVGIVGGDKAPESPTSVTPRDAPCLMRHGAEPRFQDQAGSAGPKLYICAEHLVDRSPMPAAAATAGPVGADVAGAAAVQEVGRVAPTKPAASEQRKRRTVARAWDVPIKRVPQANGDRKLPLVPIDNQLKAWAETLAPTSPQHDVKVTTPTKPIVPGPADDAKTPPRSQLQPGAMYTPQTRRSAAASYTPSPRAVRTIADRPQFSSRQSTAAAKLQFSPAYVSPALLDPTHPALCYESPSLRRKAVRSGVSSPSGKQDSSAAKGQERLQTKPPPSAAGAGALRSPSSAQTRLAKPRQAGQRDAPRGDNDRKQLLSTDDDSSRPDAADVSLVLLDVERTGAPPSRRVQAAPWWTGLGLVGVLEEDVEMPDVIVDVRARMPGERGNCGSNKDYFNSPGDGNGLLRPLKPSRVEG